MLINFNNMRTLILFGTLLIAAVTGNPAKILNSDRIIFPDELEYNDDSSPIDLTDSFTNNRAYFQEPRFRGPAHVMPLSAHAEPVDFNFIKQRWHALNSNRVKRSPGWKSKGGSKGKGSGSGFFSSSSKAKGNNKGKGQDSYSNSGSHNTNYGKPSAPQQHNNYGHPAGQPAYNPSYGHPPPAYNPGYGHAPAGYPGYGHAPAGYPGYGQPAYHPPAPQQPTVVVVGSGGHSGGGGYSSGGSPGLGSALATGLASGVGSGVGFGVANAAIKGITGGGSSHRDPYYERPPSNTNNNDNNNNNNGNSNSNNKNSNNDDYNAQPNPECLKTCYSTDEYVPVCGTDGWEYNNIGKLNCMKTCGKRVEVARYGPCILPTPPPGYGVNGAVSPVGGNPPPPPPPNSPVAGSPPVSLTGLPQGVEGPEGPSGVANGSIVFDNTSSSTDASVTSTTMSPQYTECFQKCNVTSEYNPLCASDGLAYSNPSKLECAKNCGKTTIEQSYQGVCNGTSTVL